ncbi:hypothetical protein [Ralstonia sp. ASV6]|uniref:hypothetical protein n=1 Tax=Ralstonia sp. ASV6 TaxID=2795124 RepID=UPI0018ED3763|nr:hypothetical protein [Ralstonia sp. ASV6]
MKRKDQTRILTEDAFWKVLARGTAPTVDKICAWLAENGYGSRDRAVINETLKTCWKKLGERIESTATLPGVPEKAAGLLLHLYEELQVCARDELNVEREELQSAAEAQLKTAQDQAQEAALDAERARAAQRESATAFETLSADRDRMRIELDEARQRHEREMERMQDLLSQARQEASGLRAQLSAEEKARASDLEAAAREQRRQALEIDGLRTEGRAIVARAEKLQADLEASLSRERELADRARDISAEMGTLRGSERALQQQVKDLQRAVGQRDEEIALLRGQLESARERGRVQDAEIARTQAALEAALPLDADQLLELISQAWASGASAPGKAVPPSDDEQAVYAGRGERYGRRALKAAGIKVRAER